MTWPLDRTTVPVAVMTTLLAPVVIVPLKSVRVPSTTRGPCTRVTPLGSAPPPTVHVEEP